MIFLSAVIIGLSFFALAMSLDRHYRDIVGSGLTAGRRRGLRFGGWTLLSIGFAACGVARGWQFGPVWFFALAAVVAMLVLAIVSLLAPMQRR